MENSPQGKQHKLSWGVHTNPLLSLPLASDASSVGTTGDYDSPAQNPGVITVHASVVDSKDYSNVHTYKLL
jgi:hypothetical protein